ncbi:cell death abnormality protein 1 [Biomphalaria glabrata]|nr:cell death abnormality protein 1 [Biomphalaria glabrata]
MPMREQAYWKEATELAGDTEAGASRGAVTGSIKAYTSAYVAVYKHNKRFAGISTLVGKKLISYLHIFESDGTSNSILRTGLPVCLDNGMDILVLIRII